MTSRRTALAFALAATLAASFTAFAADEKKPPDGTVTIDERQVALLVGGSMGGGKLQFQGKTYEFKLGGLTAGVNVGVSKMSAVGEVHNLKDVSKFPGTYTKLDVGATAGGGVGALRLKNEHGVVMMLTSRSQGMQLNVGSTSGVKVEMK